MTINGRSLWVDAHVHVYADLSSGKPAFDVGNLIAVMDADPAHLVWILTNARPDYGELSRCPADLVRLTNEAQLELVEQLPPGRAFGSIAVHPGALRESMHAIEVYATDHGFVQVGEILGYALGFDLDSPEMVAIARHAAHFGLPLQCHCSTSGQPEGEQFFQAVNLARQVPEAKVIAAHAIGGANSWMHITGAQTYYAMGGANLWLEIRDFNTRSYLRAAVRRLGADRLIVGTDWIGRSKEPYLPYGVLFNTALEQMPYPCSSASLAGFLREVGCSEAEIDLIAAGNSVRLFRLQQRVGV